MLQAPAPVGRLTNDAMTGKSLISAAFSGRHVWATYLAFGAFVCLLYLFVPPLKGSGPVINLHELISSSRPPPRCARQCYSGV